VLAVQSRAAWDGIRSRSTAHAYEQSGWVTRPANLEDVAFWPVTRLAQLLKTRQVSAVELTRMYLDRLRRYDGLLHFVITLTPELAIEQAERADREIAKGVYWGALHGIPWGAKDLIAKRATKRHGALRHSRTRASKWTQPSCGGWKRPARY
jgi:hypothetical protein